MPKKKSENRIEKDLIFSGKKIHELEIKLKNAGEIIERLKDEKQWFERVTSISPSIITVYDCKEKKNTFKNKSLMKKLGYSPNEMKKYVNNMESIVYPDDLKIIERAFKEINKMEDGKTYLMEYRVKDSKGNWQWIRRSSAVFNRDKNGKPDEIVSSHDIITDIKEKEEEIEKKKEEFKSLTENLPDLVARFDKNLRYLYISPNIKDITGVPCEKFLGKTYWEVNMPEHLCEHWDEGIKEVFRTGKTNPIEYSYKSKDGEVFFETRLIPEKDNDGKTKSVLAINRIITEIKKAEEELRLSEEKFRSIFENANDVIVIVDKFGKVLEINGKVESLIGIEREKIIGKNFFKLKLIKPKDLINLIKDYAFTVKTGKLKGKNSGEDFALSELELTTAKGETKYISASSSILRKNGKVTGFLSVIHDITDRKNAEEEIRRTDELLEKIAATSPSIITVFDLNKKENIFENKSLYESLGYKGLEAQKIKKLSHEETINTILHPDDLPKIQKFYKDVRKIKDNLTHEMEFRIKDYWGSWKWFRRLTSVFKRDSRGAVEQIISIFQNINEKKLGEETLKKSEEFNRAISQNAPIGISVRSAKGRLLSYNEAWKKIWAKTDKSIYEDMTMKRKEFVLDEHDNYLEKWREQVEKIYKEGGSLYIPELKPRIKKKGKAEWVSNYFYAIKNPDGKVDRVVILTEDITERKRAGLELLETKQLLEKITSTLPEIIAVSDLNKGINIYQNRSILEMLGYSDNEIQKLVKKQEYIYKYLLHPDDVKKINTFDKEVDTFKDNKNYEAEYRLKDSNNSWQWIRRVCRVFQRDEKGLPSHMVSVFENINDSKKAEEALRESEKTAQALLNTISETVFMQDTKGIILSMNDTAAQRLGKTKEELIGKCIYDLFPDDVKKIRRQKLHETINTGESVRLIDERDGRYYDTLGYPLYDAEHKVNKIIVFSKDITEQINYEKAIKESEERYRNLIESSPDGIIVHLEGKIIFANKSSARILGYKSSDELLNKNVLDFLHPDYAKEVAERMAKILKKGESVPFIEEKFRKQDGSYMDVEVSALPYHFKGKTAIQVITRDISYRKEAERALKESEERYKSLFESANDAIMLMKNGVFTDCNPSTLKMFGYEKEKIIGKTPFELSPEFQPDGRKSSDKGMEFLKETAKGKIQFFEWQHVNSRGELFDVEVSLNPIELGNDIYIQAILRDITERKLVENQLRKLTMAVEQSPVSIVITDTKGDIEYVNPKFTDLTGYKFDEVHNENPRILKSGNKSPEEYKNLWDTITSGNEWRGEFYNKKKNGEHFWESALIAPIKNEKGAVSNFLAIKQDITEQKIIDEKLKQSLKEKEVMLKEIHHRVKNNLQIISSLLKLQSGYTEDPEAYEHLQVSRDRVKTMALIHQQLYHSDDLSAINFEEYLKQLTSHLFSAYGADGKNIIREIHAKDILFGIDTAIPCGLIVNELVSNSLKHAFNMKDEGTVSINISKEDENYKMTISDNGCGIPDDIDFRNTQSLGMQLVITLIAQLGGEIELDRQKGTRFILTFTVNP